MEEKIDCVCVADNPFQPSRPRYVEVTPTTVGGCSTVFVFHSSLTNWRDKATKLHLFLDDIFQPSPMLFGVSVADDHFQSNPPESSPVQSSPAIVDGHFLSISPIQTKKIFLTQRGFDR